MSLDGPRNLEIRYCIFPRFCCNHIHNGLGTTSQDPRQLLSLAVVHVALQGVTSERTSWLRKETSKPWQYDMLNFLCFMRSEKQIGVDAFLTYFLKPSTWNPQVVRIKGSENLPDLLVFLQQAPLPFSTSEPHGLQCFMICRKTKASISTW